MEKKTAYESSALGSLVQTFLSILMAPSILKVDLIQQ